MKLTHKTTGLGIAAVAVLLLGTAAIADNKADKPMMGRGGMMVPPELNFAAVDTNKDGKLSKDEIAAFRKGRAASIDSNGDGKLSVAEIAAAWPKNMADRAQQFVDDRDTDGDGMLSAAEMLDPPVPANFFDMVDTNKDGVIDQTEADAAIKMMMGHHGKKSAKGAAATPAPGAAPDTAGTSGN